MSRKRWLIKINLQTFNIQMYKQQKKKTINISLHLQLALMDGK